MEYPLSQDMSREELDTVSRDNYAFLNHSTATLYHNLPPDVDDKPLARQKRKRTSPEDQAVLEAAYKRDPKPDKTARLELVEQVALGEKEVQIWFQNRRQSSRRKSRPLLPHEIAKYSSARSEALENGLSPSQGFTTEFGPNTSPSTEALQTSIIQPGTMSSRLQLPSETQSSSSGQISKSPFNELRETDQFASSPTPGQSGTQSSNFHGFVVGEPGATKQAMTQSKSLARTRPQVNCESIQPQAPFEDEARSASKKASAFVRLAMTADGNAQVTTKDASSPSPPRPSQSSVLSDPTPISSFSQRLSRSTSGRSRDSRSWEFWCDKEARSELEFKAERDASGSAAGAIGLMRSTSGRSALTSLPSKRNAIFSKQAFSAKRPRLGPDAPAFHRSSTSLGRLQGKAHRPDTLSQPRLKHSKSVTTIWVPGNDSDKENWSPERDVSAICEPQDLAHGKSRQQDKEMTETARIPTSSTGRRKPSPRETTRDFRRGDIDPEEDAELAAFMHTDLHSSSPSVEDDLDCVQGLLSLSQGNWR